MAKKKSQAIVKQVDRELRKTMARIRRERIMVLLLNKLSQREMTVQLFREGLLPSNEYRQVPDAELMDPKSREFHAGYVTVRQDLFVIRKRFKPEDDFADLDRHVFIQQMDRGFRVAWAEFMEKENHPIFRASMFREAMMCAERAATARGIDVKRPHEVPGDVVYEVQIGEYGTDVRVVPPSKDDIIDVEVEEDGEDED